ncbi:MAG: hypothetical protein JXP34_16925 [Planctomycetes bacterium]|nr:hypothetical protein [Planctomycetota bacterium]
MSGRNRHEPAPGAGTARIPYRDLLPREWFEREPEELIARRPLAEIASFWTRAGASGG